MPSLLTTPLAESLRQARRERRWALAALPLGLMLQAGMVALFLGVSTLRPPKPPRAPPSRPVSLRAVSSARWAANRGAVGASVPERPAPLHSKGQVVDVAPGNNQVPVESKYLAESNNTVKKETRAREQTQTWSRATPKTQPNPTAQPSAKGRASPQQGSTSPDLLSSALGRRPWRLVSEHSSPGSEQPAPSTEDQAPVGTELGTERSGTGDATEGGGAPNDNLNEVAAGDGTFLNTREWKYASFFNRVKQAVSARWDPNGRLRARNRELGMVERATVLVITLRPDGSLADAYVARSSGIDELDQEAVKAFEKAQPFANPPTAMVEQGGIRFSFGFTVTNGEFGGGMPRWMPGRQ